MSLEKHNNFFLWWLFAKGQFWEWFPICTSLVTNSTTGAVWYHSLDHAARVSWDTSTRFSDNAWTCKPVLPCTASCGSELSIIQSWTTNGDSYSTGFTRINNAPLNDITANDLTTCSSMKCGFISPKCTLVSMAVQVKQNGSSDVITL